MLGSLVITQAADVLARIGEPDGWTFRTVDGIVRVINEDLPGRLVISVVRQDPVLWIIVDLDKPESEAKVAQIVAGWRHDSLNRWATLLYSDAGVEHTLYDVERLVTCGAYGDRFVVDEADESAVA